MSDKTRQSQRVRGARFLARNLLCGVSAVAAIMASGAPSRAQAEDRYWDANGTLVGTGGAGTWNLGNLHWSPSNDGVSGPYTAWSNIALDDAIFGGTAGTVTLGAPITVHNLRFNTAGYILTGGTLTLGGVAPTITNGGTASIYSVIAGSSGLTKTGAGSLLLYGNNTFTGGVYLNQGGLNVSSDAALGAASNSIFTGAGASVGIAIGGVGTNREIHIGDGGALSIGGSGGGSALITGNGRVSVANGTTLSNDANTYTGSTTFNGINGIAYNYFTSIGNLGEASSLGAPTTVSNGTIIFNQASQYSDNIIYLGSGDSSNRNWAINGNGGNIRNRGTGALSITGDIAVSGTGIFGADTADVELLGTLSGGSYVFNGNAGGTLTLGGENIYTGVTSIGVITVQASVLADAGSASSFGAGSGVISITNNSTLRYTGAGGSSNRAWAVVSSGRILNDGTDALALSGAVNLGTVANNNFTLGGGYAGINTLSGVISGAGSLISNGSGTWVLGGANSYTGTVTVASGTLAAGSAQAFGTPNAATVNGGTLDLGGFAASFTSLSGTGGTVALTGADLTVEGSASTSFAGALTGTGGLLKRGTSTLTLTGANTYTGDTTINGGALNLDFSPDGGPTSNILSGGSALTALTMTGGGLTIRGAAGETNIQSFNGLNITAGGNRINAISGAGGSLTVNLGAITRTGGLIDFALPDSGNITTSNTVLGGWATVNGADYAKVVGGNITAFTAADYTTRDDAATWLGGEFITDDDGNATSFYNSVTGSLQLGGLRYTVADPATSVTIGTGETLGVDGAIIVASTVGNNNQKITGGSLTGASGGSVLGLRQNGGGIFTIASSIVDNNGDTIGFTKAGTGTAALTGANSYTGATTLSGGRLEINSLANAGSASSIGAASADASNLALESGTLAYVGSADSSTDRGFTLVNGGAGVPTIEVNGNRSIEFSGLVTSLDDVGLTKTGGGTLILSNAANDYLGVTTVSGVGGVGGASVLSVNTLTNGGVAGGIGAASSDAANLVLTGGGTLQYTGDTVGINRGFTLDTGSGRIDVAKATTTLTIGGTAVGVGGLIKEGEGILVLTGTNSYSGGTTVNSGTLRAGSVAAFGSQIAPMAVNTGATLDLGGFNVKVGALRDGALGGGRVLLGTSTLTTGGANGTFTGTIEGGGGLTQAGGGTQILNGCNNSYTGVTTITGGVLSVNCLADGGLNSGIGASTSESEKLIFGNGTLAYTGGSVSIDRGFTLQAGAGAIQVDSAATVLEFEGVVGGSGGLKKQGAGTLILSGQNTYTGDTAISAGTLRAGSNKALGSRGFIFTNAAGVTLDLNDLDNSIGFLSGGGALGGNITLGTATLTLAYNSGSSVFAGAISGSGGLVKTGGLTQGLTGCDSSYTGSTVINGGAFVVTCLADGGVASSIGASTADAGNLVINGGTLRYAGTGGSTNRQFTLGASGGNVLDASGTGAIAFTSTAPLTFSSPNSAQTLTLRGTNIGNNILAAQITNNGNGVTALTKTDAGTWILTNPASSYTGITTISGGVLGVDKLADGGLVSSLGASSAAASNLVIGNNSTLRYTGTGDTTNRLFTLAAGTTSIESSGTGAVVFTDTGLVTLAGNNQTRTIALGGTNAGDNTLAGSIRNAGTGATTLAKNDSGTWVLTGNNGYTGNTVINAGTLKIGSGGTTGSIVSPNTINLGTLVFDRSDAYTYAGVISDVGNVEQIGTGTTILTGNNVYTGGTTIRDGTLQLGNGAASGSIVGDVANAGELTFNRSDSYTFAGLVSGTGTVSQIGSGTTILTADNSYTGGTTISAGTLQLGNGGTTGGVTGDVVNNGNFAINRSNSVTFGGSISGSGAFSQLGGGTTILTADNSYTGGTTISAGALQIGNGGTGGAIVGDVANDGTFIFNRSDDVGFDGVISGSGALAQVGSGTLTFTAANSYTGATEVNAGTLFVNGDQSAAVGQTNVASGATLGGSGTIGGDVVMANGATLAAGSDGVGTLTINGGLSLSNGTILNYEFGQADIAGGALNDLVNVGGNLVLDGTINVTVPATGSFGAGIYRVFNYGGALDDQGLTLGTLPAGSDIIIQTAVAGQVSLVNSAGLLLNFWDGNVGPKFDGVVNGGDGIWQNSTGNNNWTGSTGSINAAYADGGVAIFSGAAGTVTIDNGLGGVTAQGMQFATGGYAITGNPLTLVGPESMIRVGDGTALGAGFTATIASNVTGASQLVKTDLGTLVLTGTNSYTSGTAINGGTLRVASDANLGAVTAGLGFNGGTLNTTANMVSARDVTLTGTGTVLTNSGTTLELSGAIAGSGPLTKDGAGTLLLTNDATYAGGTTITSGTLQLGNGGTSGGIVGNVANNGTLIFKRSDSTTFAGAIMGTGRVDQSGLGTTIFAGVSSYAGETYVNFGELRLEGGGQITATSRLNIGFAPGDDGMLTVSGAGSRLALATGNTNYVGANGRGVLTVENGGSVEAAGALQVGVSAAGTINVTGAQSNLAMTNSAGLTLGMTDSTGELNILDGGSVRNSGEVLFGNLAAVGIATVSGPGSTWDIRGGLNVRRGSLSVLVGGVVTANAAALALDSGDTQILVSGAGSRFETDTMLSFATAAAATGALTIADGGVVKAGSGALAMGTGNAALNIGGAEGATATGAGLLDATSVTTNANSRVNFNHTNTDYIFAAAISGTGKVNQAGIGTTILTANNSYTGATTVNAGILLVNGDQSAATGATSVLSGATLGGIGTIGGDVIIADGGNLNPGSLGTAPGTLTINGALGLSGGSILNYDFGQANVVGGPFNDLVTVGGDLVLDGALNVTAAAGGSFDPGIYRVIDYAGTLTNNALVIGAIPTDTDFYVQTSVAQQVNLINTNGLALRFWDGDAGIQNDGVITGGDGLWRNDGVSDNWTLADATINAPFLDAAFAVFQGTGGTVTTDESLGAINVSGMQFAADGYVIQGNAINLVAPQSVVRVGDGTAAGTALTATIGTKLAGNGQLVKTDLGTLILTGANSYAGGTAINGGTLRIAADANLGDAAGGLGFAGGTLQTTTDLASDRTVSLTGAGTLLTDSGTVLTLSGAISGAGSLTKDGAGSLILTADSDYAGSTAITAGTLQFGDGGTAGAIISDIANDGVLVFSRADAVTFDGLISGTGVVEQDGVGTTIFTADNSYAGATTVHVGTLLVNGDQSAAIGATSVLSGATLGGVGTIGGDVTLADGASLNPGAAGLPATLTINGNLELSGGSTLNYQFGQANVVGGALNDLVNVGGNLTLDGTINVAVPATGSFDAGIYRVFNYGGTLADNGLSLGTMPAGSAVVVQTSVTGQVNLVNSAGLLLTFWDGDAGPKYDGLVNGGDGTWQNSTGNNNWTEASGGINAGFSDGALAIFSGAAGTVTVDNGLGAVSTLGMQFASDGYIVTGDPLTLVGPQSIVRVGDGTVLGADFTATIASNVIGASQLAKAEQGTLVLTGTNSYTGGTAINSGTLRIASDANLGAVTGDLGFNGGILNTTANMVSARNVVLAGAGTFLTDPGTKLELSAAITGSGPLTKDGAGTLLLTNDATYVGGTTITSGTLQLGDGGTSGSIIGDVANNGTLVFDRGDDVAFAGAISGTGAVIQNGADTTDLTGISTYTGNTTVNAGALRLASGGQITSTLRLFAGNNLGESGTITVDGTGSKLNIAGSAATPSILGNDGTGTLHITGGGAVTGGLIQLGSGGTGQGTLNVSGAGSSYSTTMPGSVGSSIWRIGDQGSGSVHVTAGGQIRNSGNVWFGAMGGTGTATVSGNGSTWTIGEALELVTGTLSVLDGGVVLADSANIGHTPLFAGSNDVLVSGAGSRLETTAGFRLNAASGHAAALTIADGGIVSPGGGALAMTGGDTALNIGGAEGAGATAAGILDASTLTMATATNRVNFNHSDANYVFDTLISGAGAVNQTGSGTTILAANSDYTGATTIKVGTLLVNGDQSAATGATAALSGATLGGIGTIGGDVTITDGANLNPGAAGLPGTLTINGNLGFADGSVLNYDFGQANVMGGPLNDLVTIGGNLTLDGTLNVTVPTGGSFGAGVYHVMTYGGTLTDNGLNLGTMPADSDVFVQTAVAKQVNLVNTAGLELSFWDGPVGPKNDGTIQGGTGTWRLGGGANDWTELTGAVNADYAQDAFAVFMGVPGTVTVDNGGGAVRASGLQFAAGGYVIDGGPLTLSGAAADVRVGDGTAAGAAMTATIAADLTGTAQLVKADLGRLVLTGANNYAGGTAITAGTLQLGDGGATGLILGNVANNGMLVFDRSDAVTFDGLISGTGAVSQVGTGTTILTADASYTGGTAIIAGALQLGDGGTTGSIAGDVANDGALVFNRSDALTVGGLISGAGSVAQNGSGTAILTGSNSYAGGTTITAGTLQLGDGGATGSIVGNVVNNGVLAFHRSDALTFGGLISGMGAVEQNGAGTTILTGTNNYAGATRVNAGIFLVNGDQSAATGATSVASGATLGGFGTIGGDVTIADGGNLAPGAAGTAPGTLTINGNLGLSGGSALNYDFGEANVVGGPLNDLVMVGGNLTLDGTLNVTTAAGGRFDPGIYRVIDYAGTLTNEGLAIGTTPAGTDFYVQTSVAQQVNLINTNGLALRFWDGDAGVRNDGLITGGDGLWRNDGVSDNWTLADATINAPFLDAAFAVFQGTGGAVTTDTDLGAINVSGMQFAADGYVIQGDAINLVAPQSLVRVGDGTAAGTAMTATIGAALAGNGQLVKTDLGTLILTGANSYTGGTAIKGGTLRIAADANLGDAAGGLGFAGGTLQTTADLTSNRTVSLMGAGTLLTGGGTNVSLGGVISGVGSLAKAGTGTLILSGANDYAGATTVEAGTLLVNGDQSEATGLMSVNNGATLGGAGTIGGNVTIADGGTLAPGNSPGTLVINGNLSLAAGSMLHFEFGQANVVGGALNDLVTVGGDLVLDGTLNVTVPTGGAFDPGIYRVFDYAGRLTDNGLQLGGVPVDSTSTVQTSIGGQVNLVNTGGLLLNFWDGAAGPKFDGVINGGDGLWQNSTGNDHWTDAAGAVNAAYTDTAVAIFAGAGGQVTVDGSLGDITASGMQFASDGYAINGDAITLTGPQSTIRVGDGTTVGADMTATIGSALIGNTQLVKTDAGTLILSGSNGYTGGTAINGGTLQIAADAHLGDGAGGLSFNGGTLRTTADFDSDRAVTFAGTGTILTDDRTTFTLNGLLSSTGELTKHGNGTLLLTGDNSGYTAATHVTGGTLAVENVLGSAVDVRSGGRLEGNGQVGSITNSGVVAPGRGGIGTLTVAGDYTGNGGTLEIEAVLGADGSSTDRLVVNGATSGSTQVNVLNRGGLGAQTVEGIKIIDVAGASNGTFALNGDYAFQGEQAVIAGAYGYRLYQNGIADPADGDWYLRSALLNPATPEEPQGPLYQPGVPIYEGYAQNLLALNGLPTLQQRVGNRSWAGAGVQGGMGIWGRMEGSRQRPSAVFSTSGADKNSNTWQMQMGLDRTLGERPDGAMLIGGITAYYGKADSSVWSIFGNGSIKTEGYGLGATLTYYGPQGFYADGQAQMSWYDSDLNSGTLGTLVDGNNGKGQAFSLEVGKRSPVGGKLTLTPQIQMVYSHVNFDRFVDPAGAAVSSAKGSSLKTRWGLSIDHQNSWDGGSGNTRRSHLYALVNLSYEWLDGTRADVSGTPIVNRDHRLSGEIGLGASYSWGGNRFTLYSEVSADTSIADFGNGYSLKGNAGLRIKF